MDSPRFWVLFLFSTLFEDVSCHCNTLTECGLSPHWHSKTQQVQEWWWQNRDIQKQNLQTRFTFWKEDNIYFQRKEKAVVKIQLLYISNHKCCPLFKRDQMASLWKLRDVVALALCGCYSVPALYSRGSECLLATGGYHAVSILYPWASPQQWPTWESGPGSGINQLPPSLDGLLPVRQAAAPAEPSWVGSPWEPAGIPRDEDCVVSKACGETIFCLEIWHGGPQGQWRGRRLQTGFC